MVLRGARYASDSLAYIVIAVKLASASRWDDVSKTAHSLLRTHAQAAFSPHTKHTHTHSKI